MRHIKKYYLNLLDKDRRNLSDIIIYLALCVMSFAYGLVVLIRNVLYDFRILPVYTPAKKVISIGNISWGGSGKTSIAGYLHENISLRFRTASITKGYARDEFMMLKERLGDVFDAKDRVSLIKRLEEKFDVFILDDGFQYRRLKRDLDIVVLTQREFRGYRRLIPAYILREPILSLKRANIIVINYWRKIYNINKVKEEIFSINPKAKIYLADYIYKGFMDRNRRDIALGYFRNRKTGVLTAIGYPAGFINLLSSLDIDISKKIIYPDHYNFSAKEVENIENDFKKEGINDIIITRKDFYHLDLRKASLDYFIMEADLKIENEEEFLREVNKFIEGDKV
ncbi:MAG: tetraacyldisaccharide 4'-kinase [Candidatus Omnitrophica bacterium 4484_171]|nr:MAG: tetraacyldisaccharide 4'-kinase [Candidatus Omnitrophica bacterium 4484_171]